MSKDFTGLSELLLGQAQPAQFQGAGQTRYIWGSIYNENGETVGTDSACSNKTETGANYMAVYNGDIGKCVENNSRAEMPRTYISTNDAYYNWYAATAESGTYATTVKASDSVCPSGWQLPENDSRGKSFRNVISSSDTSDTIRQLPLSLTASQRVYWVSGGAPNKTTNIGEMNYWLSNAPTAGESPRLTANTSGTLNLASNDRRANGFSVRCVQK